MKTHYPGKECPYKDDGCDFKGAENRDLGRHLERKHNRKSDNRSYSKKCPYCNVKQDENNYSRHIKTCKEKQKASVEQKEKGTKKDTGKKDKK